MSGVLQEHILAWLYASGYLNCQKKKKNNQSPIAFPNIMDQVKPHTVIIATIKYPHENKVSLVCKYDCFSPRWRTRLSFHMSSTVCGMRREDIISSEEVVRCGVVWISTEVRPVEKLELGGHCPKGKAEGGT